jgi:hypothetical protein
MESMWLTIWILTAYGLSQILVYGSIFESLRQGLHKWGADKKAPFQSIGEFLSGLIKCMMCTSTWVGFFMSLVLFSPTNYCFDTNILASIFFDGMLASGSVWAVNAIIEWFEKK